jgi:exodeoxyribonuclease V alpha subunit
MLHAPFGIVTGGPGTGKTFTVRTALDELDARGQIYKLAAPTGKAARRMSEATGRPASTVHRLLGWTPRGWTFDSFNPIEADVVIIDESSMLDIELAAALVDAIGEDTRLIFVGDANQLPSVGPGRVLADLVESEMVPVARLTHVHRAAAESWVCRNAPRVLAGAPLELSNFSDFRYVEAESIDDVAATVRRLIAQPEYLGAQILAPQRNTAAGVEALNAALQQQLNPPGTRPEWKLGEKLLRVGDRVIQTANAYKLEAESGELGVFNGEVGTILEIDNSDMRVDFGDRCVRYSKEAAFALDLAYALTTHKSQGSEFEWVICIVHSAHSYMLTRQLFYTAITRAKKGVVIVGNRKGIEVATSAKPPPPRNTGLVERMRTFEADNDNDNDNDASDGAHDFWGDEDYAEDIEESTC